MRTEHFVMPITISAWKYISIIRKILYAWSQIYLLYKFIIGWLIRLWFIFILPKKVVVKEIIGRFFIFRDIVEMHIKQQD